MNRTDRITSSSFRGASCVWAACLSLLGGCADRSQPTDGSAAIEDLANADLANADLATSASADLLFADLALVNVSADLAKSDLTVYLPPNPCVAAGTCPPGEWVNVTPPTINLDPNFACDACNYGASDVLVDPVRPNDVYAFFCYQGVWKSTDYGMHWTHISTGTNANHIESGRPATAAIDPNPARDPATPPTLYTVSLYGDQLGIYKSIDGGINWSFHQPNNTQGPTSNDAYAIDIDPTNSQHLLTGFHDVGLSESLDGGETWKTIPVPSDFGISVYPFFVTDTVGNLPTPISSTWITEAQWTNNTHGVWRTTDAGKTWTRPTVGSAPLPLEHGHGGAQMHMDGKGVIYAAGNAANLGVIFRSVDYGVTWVAAKNDNRGQGGVFGTPNYFYATNHYAYLGDYPQHLQRSPASDGINWVDWTPVSPPGMNNGAKRMAVTYDGSHYILVGGHGRSGLWRYVEE